MKISLPLPLLLAGSAGLLLVGGAVGFQLKPSSTLPVVVAEEHMAGAPASRVSTVGEVASGSLRTPLRTGEIPPSSTGASTVRPLSLQELTAATEEIMGGGLGMRGISAMVEFSERLQTSDLPGMAAALSNQSNDQIAAIGFQMLMTAWGERDGAVAWNFALGLPANQRRNSALMAAMQGVTNRDAGEAWGLVETLQDEQLSLQMRSTVLRTMARQDPAKAFALATANASPRDDDFSLPMVIAQWARQDMTAAQAAVNSLSGSVRERALRSLLSAMAESDPAAAWKYATSLPANAGEPHRDARLTVLQRWVSAQPQEALQAALSLPDGSLRQTAITRTLSAWSQNDFSAALDYTLGIGETTLRSEALLTLSQNRVGNLDALFHAVLEHMPAGENFQRAMDSIFSSWARENPHAAAAALASLPSGRMQAQATRQVVQEWANSSVEGALRFAHSLPSGEARSRSLEAVYQQWSSRDPAAALRGFQSLQEVDRRAVMQPIASSWGRQDPSAALTWSSNLADASDRRDFQRHVVTQWADTAPREAAQFAARLPEEDRSGALQAAVDRWASRDAEAAANWLASQPTGEWKDGAIGALARKIAPEDPAVALAWLGSITQENQRNRHVSRVFRDWVRQEPQAARGWLQQSNLSAEQREQLLRD